MTPTFSTQLKKLLTGGGVLFFGLVAELGISFLAKAVIARFLGAVDYGAVSLGVTTLGLLSTLTLLGLHTGVSRYLPRFDDAADRRGILLSAATVSIPIATATGLGIAILATPISTVLFTDPTVAPIIRIFALAIPFAALMKLCVGVIRGLQKTVPRVVVQNITPPVTRFTAVMVAVVLGTGAIGVATAYAVAYVVAATVGVYYVITRSELFASVAPTHMRRELLSFSAPLIVSAAMAFILTDLDTFMLGYFSSTRDVGIYNVVYPIAQLLTIGLTSFSFLLMPIISELDSKKENERMLQMYQIVTKWIFMGTLPVFMVIAVFPEMTIVITFGREYVDGALALSLLSVAYFSHAIAGPNADVLTSLGHTRLIMWDNIVIGVINTILNIILIPNYGFLGAGTATAISYLALNAIYLIQLYQQTGIHPFSASLIRPGVVAVILTAVVSWLTRTLFTVTVPLLIVVFLIFIISYVIIILRFGGVQEEEVEIILSFENRIDLNLGPIKRVVRYLIT